MNEIDLVRGMVQFAASGLDNVMAQARQLETAANAATKAVGATADKIDKLGSSSGLSRASKEAEKLAKDMELVVVAAKKAGEAGQQAGVLISKSFGEVDAKTAALIDHYAEKQGLAGTGTKYSGVNNLPDFLSRVSASGTNSTSEGRLQAASFNYVKEITQKMEGWMSSAMGTGLNTSWSLGSTGAGRVKINTEGLVRRFFAQNYSTDISAAGLGGLPGLGLGSSGAGLGGLKNLLGIGENVEVMRPDKFSRTITVAPSGGMVNLPGSAGMNFNLPFNQLPFVNTGMFPASMRTPGGVSSAPSGMMAALSAFANPNPMAGLTSFTGRFPASMYGGGGPSGPMGAMIAAMSAKTNPMAGLSGFNTVHQQFPGGGGNLQSILAMMGRQGGVQGLGIGSAIGSGMGGSLQAVSTLGSDMQRVLTTSLRFSQTILQTAVGFRVIHEATRILESGLRAVEKIATSVVSTLGKIAVGAFHTMFNSPLKSLALMDDRLRAMSRFIQNSPITRTATILSFGSITGTGEMFGIGSVVRRSFTRLIHEGLSEVTKSSEWSQLGTSITKLMRELLDGLAPYIRMATQLVQELTTAWQGLDQETKNSVLRWGMLVVGFSGMVALLPTIIGGLGGLAQVIDLVIKPADILLTAFGNLAAAAIQFSVSAVSSIAKVAISFAATLAQGIMSAIGLIGQLTIGLLGIAAMAISMGPMFLVVAPLVAAIGAIGAGLASGAAVTFFNAIINGANVAGEWLSKLWSYIVEFASGVPEAMNAAGKGIRGMFQNLVNDWRETLKTGVVSLISLWNDTLLPGIVGGVKTMVSAFVEGVAQMRIAFFGFYNTIRQPWNSLMEAKNTTAYLTGTQIPGIRPGTSFDNLTDQEKARFKQFKQKDNFPALGGNEDDPVFAKIRQMKINKFFDSLLQAGKINGAGVPGFLDKAFNVAGGAGAAALDFVGKAIQWAQNPGNNKDQGLGFGKGGTWGSGQDIFDRIQAGLAATSDPTVKEIAKGNGILGMIKEGIDVIKNKNGIIKE